MTGAEILALVPVVIGAMIGLWVCRLPDHQPNRLAVRPPVQGQQPRGGAGNSGAAPKKPKPESLPWKPVPMSPAIRAELDDTPAYWEHRFHQLLEGLGAPVVVGETWEFRTWANDVAYEYAERGYLDCPCTNCRRICHA